MPTDPPTPDARPARVLVVDDDEAKRYVVAHTLRLVGFEVVEGACGDDALRLAPSSDLLVLDVRMPGASGYDVCRRLKDDPATALVPVLLMSATFVDADSQVRGLESGADAYLRSPSAVRVAIYRKSAARPASSPGFGLARRSTSRCDQPSRCWYFVTW